MALTGNSHVFCFVVHPGVVTARHESIGWVLISAAVFGEVALTS
jgi:hypothetical protein